MKTIISVLILFASSQYDMLYLSINDLTIISEDIIEGKVISINTKWDENHRHILTETKIKVEKSYKDNIKSSEITLTEFGGRIGEYETFMRNQAKYQLNERVFVFIENNNKKYSTSGFNQGKFTFSKEKEADILIRDINEDNLSALKNQSIIKKIEYNIMKNSVNNLIQNSENGEVK